MAALIREDSPYLDKLTKRPEDAGRIVEYILAASESIERYCKRRFTLDTYDEILACGQNGEVFFGNFPVSYVARVLSWRGEVMHVQNSGSVTSASVAVSATGMRVTSLASGVSTVTTLNFTDYPTVSGLATAITALGSGWLATAVAGYELYPSADLIVGQYRSCKQSAAITSWLEQGFNRFNVNPELGIAYSAYNPGHTLRVIYQAGFAQIPDPIQKVCSDMVCNMFDSTQQALASETIGEYSYTLAIGEMNRLPIQAKQILDTYRDRKLSVPFGGDTYGGLCL